MPEALEKWSIDLVGKLLPRHLDLIYLINFFFIEELKKKHPSDYDKWGRMSIIEESYPKKIRMANLCMISTHAVNGVARLHTELLKSSLFKDFHEFYPHKISNKTNGVTPRRWIHCCNKDLSALITDQLGGDDDWIRNLDMLRELSNFTEDEEF